MVWKETSVQEDRLSFVRVAKGLRGGNQLFFSGARHTLNSALQDECFPQSRNSDMIYQLHWSASARIAGAGTVIVSYDSLVEIGSLAGIVGAVTAA